MLAFCLGKSELANIRCNITLTSKKLWKFVDNKWTDYMVKEETSCHWQKKHHQIALYSDYQLFCFFPSLSNTIRINNLVVKDPSPKSTPPPNAIFNAKRQLPEFRWQQSSWYKWLEACIFLVNVWFLIFKCWHLKRNLIFRDARQFLKTKSFSEALSRAPNNH